MAIRKNRRIGRRSVARPNLAPNRWKITIERDFILGSLQIYDGTSAGLGKTGGVFIRSHALPSPIFFKHFRSYATVNFDYGGNSFGFDFNLTGMTLPDQNFGKSISNGCVRDELVAGGYFCKSNSAYPDIIFTGKQNLDTVSGGCGAKKLTSEFIIQVPPDADFRANVDEIGYDWVTVTPFFMSEYTGRPI